MTDIDKWRLNLLKAVEAQANDETLWATNILGEPDMKVGIAEAYMQQSLRWLHQVVEENDLEALQWIVNQSKGDI